MTKFEAFEMLQAKLNCIILDDLSRIEQGCLDNCYKDNCHECDYYSFEDTRYEQALCIAINVLRESL